MGNNYPAPKKRNRIASVSLILGISNIVIWFCTTVFTIGMPILFLVPTFGLSLVFASEWFGTLYPSIFFIVPILSAFAIIFGVRGRANSAKGARGKGRATAGMGLGIVAFFLDVLLIAVIT